MENNVLCPKSTSLVEYVFAIFYAICSGFDSQFHDIDKLKIVKTQWILAFKENNLLCKNDIENGLAKLRQQIKLINIPSIGEFIAWCKESEKEQFLDEHQAYMIAFELMRGEEREGLTANQKLIIKHATKNSDYFFMKQQSAHATKPIFCRNYEIAIRDFKAGNLKPIPKAIEDNSKNKKNKKSDCQIAEKHLSKLKEMLK